MLTVPSKSGLEATLTPERRIEYVAIKSIVKLSVTN